MASDQRPHARYALPVALTALIALVAIVLVTGLPSDYVFDDIVDVARNPAATPEHFAHAVSGTVRPVLKASYAATAAVFGSSAPAQRAVNLALHLAATLLVYVVLRRLTAPRGLDGGRWLALLGAGIWALHPLVVETVTYVSGRSMGLSSLLLLGTFALATREPLPRGARWCLATSLLAALAPLARETALVLPALLLLWQLTLGADESPRQALRRQLPVWVGVVAAAMLLALLPRHRELVAFSLRVRDPLEAVLGNIHAVPSILALWAAPWWISIDPPAPDVYGWLELPTLWRLGALGAAAAFVIVGRRRAAVAAFAVGWTLLTLLPTNSIIWRIDPVGTRPLYLASLGPALGLAWLIAAGAGAGRRVTARATLVGAGLLITGLCWATVGRAALYRAPAALWEDAARKAPSKARPHANLGLVHLQAGRLDAAERALRTALDLEPWDREAACALEAVRIQQRYAVADDARSEEGVRQ